MTAVTETGQRPEHYAPLAKWLHWIVAACILTLIPVGIVMGNLSEGALQNRLYDLHRSLGFVVLVLMILRLAVRTIRGAPPPYAGLTRFERIASTATHHLLYLLLCLMPIGGWVMTSAYGATISVFGLFNLPQIVAKNEALFELLLKGHKAGGILVAVLVIMHVGGALMHTFVKRDIVLWRMLPKSWS